MLKKKYPIVKIEWVDAEVDAGWKTPEEIAEMKGADCITVGFLVRKPTKKAPCYVIAHTVGADHEGDVNGVIKIPRQWVKAVSIVVESENGNDK